MAFHDFYVIFIVMTVSKVNVDKAIEDARGGLEHLNKGVLPGKEFEPAINDLIVITEILLERFSRNRPGKKSSEKSKRGGDSQDKGEGEEEGRASSNPRPPRDQLPSERYPDVPVIEKELTMDTPTCPCCGDEMKDSGMRESSEVLTVIPKKYVIYRFVRPKYSCSNCYGALVTAPSEPRILPGSSYGDDLIVDVSLSKYCDLIPMERYAAMAQRNGLEGLPPNSLITLTHRLSDFLELIYLKLKEEVSKSRVIHSDETPHRMLEGGGDKKTWYLWGLSSETSCFFDIRNTRSGEVASEFLKDSSAEVLVSDVFSGYGKAVSDTNAYREENNQAPLKNAWCNAHARRKFREAETNFKEETKVFVHCYKEIYRLEHESAGLDKDLKREYRQKMIPYFERMKKESESLSARYSPHLSISKAVNYFLRNFNGLTLCLKDPEIPLDNNSQERKLRPPVVGRKTWYGNHSQRGAKTTAVLFSLVGACQSNDVNPREYFPYVVGCIHRGEDPPTPYEYISHERGPP